MITVNGVRYGQAEHLAAALTSPQRRITAARVRDWARRSRCPGDPLYGLLPGERLRGQRTGTTWYRLRHAADVERLTRDRVRSSHTDPTGGPCPRGV